jgi:hypothetical protein
LGGRPRNPLQRGIEVGFVLAVRFTALLTAPDPAHRTVDTFLIKLNRKRTGTVVWPFADIGPLATKSTALSTSCMAAR